MNHHHPINKMETPNLNMETIDGASWATAPVCGTRTKINAL